jgi:hypothetical protein
MIFVLLLIVIAACAVALWHARGHQVVYAIPDDELDKLRPAPEERPKEED